MPAGAAKRATDALIIELAGDQHGVVTRRALLAAGVSRHAIAERLASGLLAAPHPGVYTVGGRPADGATLLLLAASSVGPHALVGFRSGSAMHHLLESNSRTVDVVTTVRARPRPGVRLHHTRWLPAEEVTARAGIPVTSVARTLVDLAATEPVRQIERALEAAETLRVLDGGALERAMSHPRPGTAVLRAVLGDIDLGTTVTRGVLEEAFLELVRACGLPMPLLNHAFARPGGGHVEVDAWFAERRVAVELQGARFHSHPRAIDRDSAKQTMLATMGVPVLRFTWRHVTREPAWVEAELRRALGCDRPAAR